MGAAATAPKAGAGGWSRALGAGANGSDGMGDAASSDASDCPLRHNKWRACPRFPCFPMCQSCAHVWMPIVKGVNDQSAPRASAACSFFFPPFARVQRSWRWSRVLACMPCVLVRYDDHTGEGRAKPAICMGTQRRAREGTQAGRPGSLGIDPGGGGRGRVVASLLSWTGKGHAASASTTTYISM